LGVRVGFKGAYPCRFLACSRVGTTMNFERLADFSDAVFFLMAIPNVIGIYLLAPVVKRELAHFLDLIKRGEVRSARTAPEAPIASP